MRPEDASCTLPTHHAVFKDRYLKIGKNNGTRMATRDTHVTAEQFNEFAKILIDTLNNTHEYIYRRFDSIENRLSTIEAEIADLRKSVSGIQSNVASVKRDTKLLPPTF